MAIDSKKPLVTKLRKKPVPPATETPEPMSSLFADASEDYVTDEEDGQEVPYAPGKAPRRAITPLPVGGSLNKPRLPKSRT